MKSTDDQGLIPVIVASEADSTYIRTIPTAQATTGDGSVSLDLGLPPECATAVAAGGKRPEMKDMNGIWNLFSRAIQSLQAYRGVYNASFATAIGGYPKYAMASDSSGNFWVSTADANTTVPGATGATWRNLFADYLPLTGGDITEGLTVKENPVVVGVGSDHANTITELTYDFENTALGFLDGAGTWRYAQPLGNYPEVSDFVAGWGQNGYIEIPTSGNWKLVVQWVQFQGVTGAGGNNGAGRYETADIFVTWPLGMGNLLSIPGLAVEDVVGVGMQEQVWKMANPTATGGSFRMACNASGVTMNGSAVILGSIAA